MSYINIQGDLGPPTPPSDAHEHGAFYLRRRKSKAFCERPFAFHRHQFEKYEQNVDVAPPGKISANAHGLSIALTSYTSSCISKIRQTFCLLVPRFNPGPQPVWDTMRGEEFSERAQIF